MREAADLAVALRGLDEVEVGVGVGEFGSGLDVGRPQQVLSDEMGEPAGAATAIEIMTEADASLFI